RTGREITISMAAGPFTLLHHKIQCDILLFSVLYCKRVKGSSCGGTLNSITQGNIGYVSAGNHCAAALLWLRDGSTAGPTRTRSGERREYLSSSRSPATAWL